MKLLSPLEAELAAGCATPSLVLGESIGIGTLVADFARLEFVELQVQAVATSPVDVREALATFDLVILARVFSVGSEDIKPSIFPSFSLNDTLPLLCFLSLFFRSAATLGSLVLFPRLVEPSVAIDEAGRFPASAVRLERSLFMGRTSLSEDEEAFLPFLFLGVSALRRSSSLVSTDGRRRRVGVTGADSASW
jgi:hypothetical protein